MLESLSQLSRVALNSKASVNILIELDCGLSVVWQESHHSLYRREIKQSGHVDAIEPD